MFVLELNIFGYNFALNLNKSMSCFNGIYYDIWGGYSTPSLSSAHNFLTIVDDFSLKTWVYLMCFKSDTYSCLTQFYAFV